MKNGHKALFVSNLRKKYTLRKEAVEQFRKYADITVNIMIFPHTFLYVSTMNGILIGGYVTTLQVS